jgi:hypothetical protein
MFRVEWLQSALDELTTLWIQADPTLRQALTAASHTIDQRLSINPRGEGESRSGKGRENVMRSLEIEARVAILEAEVERLRAQVEPGVKPAPWWERITATFADDPAHEQAMKLGRQYRQSLRPAVHKPRKR